MKKIALAAAAMVSSAAFATTPMSKDMTVEEGKAVAEQTTPEQGLPNDPYEGYEGVGGPNTEVYDGPNSYTPSQPPPSEANGITMSQAKPNFQPVQRAEYPACSTEIRDNCRQPIDPR